MDRYDVAFGQNPTASPATIGYLSSDVATKYMTLKGKIERAKEKQCAQVFETGIVTLINGDNIDLLCEGAYAILPPSPNKDWVIPLNGELPLLDPFEWGLAQFGIQKPYSFALSTLMLELRRITEKYQLLKY